MEETLGGVQEAAAVVNEYVAQELAEPHAFFGTTCQVYVVLTNKAPVA